MNKKINQLSKIYAYFIVVLSITLFNIIYPLDVSAQEFHFQWGVPGDGDGQFSTPSGIAIDSLNNVYVVDTGNYRIQKFNAQGEFILSWGTIGSGNGQFNSPLGIGIDPNDEIYVADSLNHRIQKFDGNGTYITSWGSLGDGNGQFNEPNDVAIDSYNNLYITDSVNNRVQKFDSQGNFLFSLDSDGVNVGRFDSPNAIAIDLTDRVLVADSSNQIKIFNSDGKYISTYGGTTIGSFLGIMGITSDAENYIYVSESGNIRITKLDDLGYYLTKWGVFGRREGELNWPYGIAVNLLGHIYVVDSHNNRIQVFIPPLQPTYSILIYNLSYSLTNNRIVEENGLTCDPEEDSSGGTSIGETPWNEARGYFEKKYYSGFVSGSTYNMTHTEMDNNFIITKRFLFTLTSQVTGFGTFYSAKTDNSSSYCMLEGDMKVTLKEREIYHLQDYGSGGGSSCFISSSYGYCMIN